MRQLNNVLLATTLILAATSGSLRAQENLPMGPSNYEHDFQLFAPFDLDLDNMSDPQWSGYFFEYNKLFWSYSGVRVTIGSPDVTETIDTNDDGIPDTTVQGQFAEII